MKAQKSSFESFWPFADSIRSELVAELSEAAIDIDEYLFIDTHITHIFCVVPSDDMLACMTKRAIRATG
jgi:hypothetical protein